MALYARTLWRLNVPVVCPWAPNVVGVTATHIKFIHVKYEIVRDDQTKEGHRSSPAGYLYGLFAYTRSIDGYWVELRDMLGIEMELNEAAMLIFGPAALPRTTTTWNGIDLVMLNAASGNGDLPAGVLVDQDDVEIV